jgi:cytoskeletal protein RodZ
LPETRLERLVAALGLVAIIVLIAVIVRSWPAGASPGPPPHTNATPSVPQTTVESTPSTTTTIPADTAEGSRTPTLSLTAARADSWFEVHTESPTGPILYTGILPKGKTKSFNVSPLWVRFGAASNVDARIAGRLVPLAGGTYDARFAKGTLQRVKG